MVKSPASQTGCDPAPARARRNHGSNRIFPDATVRSDRNHRQKLKFFLIIQRTRTQKTGPHFALFAAISTNSCRGPDAPACVIEPTRRGFPYQSSAINGCVCLRRQRSGRRCFRTVAAGKCWDAQRVEFSAVNCCSDDQQVTSALQFHTDFNRRRASTDGVVAGLQECAIDPLRAIAAASPWTAAAFTTHRFPLVRSNGIGKDC